MSTFLTDRAGDEDAPAAVRWGLMHDYTDTSGLLPSTKRDAWVCLGCLLTAYTMPDARRGCPQCGQPFSRREKVVKGHALLEMQGMMLVQRLQRGALGADGQARVIGVGPQTMGGARVWIARLTEGTGPDDAWEYDDRGAALRAFFRWDINDKKEPEGWVRHVASGRTRPAKAPAPGGGKPRAAA